MAATAREAGLDVRTPTPLKGEAADEVPDWVRGLNADVAVVVAYGRLIPADLLDVPEHGWLNLHFSLLPAWRGAAPVQRAVIAGEEITGACVFRLEEGLDTGPVYGRITEAIGATDTSGDLLERLARAGSSLVLDVLGSVEDGSVRPEPQDDELATLAPMLSTADGEVRWDDPALTIDRRIRGVSPAPGVRTPPISGPGSVWGRSPQFRRSLIFCPVRYVPPSARSLWGPEAAPCAWDRSHPPGAVGWLRMPGLVAPVRGWGPSWGPRRPKTAKGTVDGGAADASKHVRWPRWASRRWSRWTAQQPQRGHETQ